MEMTDKSLVASCRWNVFNITLSRDYTLYIMCMYICMYVCMYVRVYRNATICVRVMTHRREAREISRSRYDRPGMI